jgi:hypothetical protein
LVFLSQFLFYLINTLSNVLSLQNEQFLFFLYHPVS